MVKVTRRDHREQNEMKPNEKQNNNNNNKYKNKQ